MEKSREQLMKRNRRGVKLSLFPIISSTNYFSLCASIKQFWSNFPFQIGGATILVWGCLLFYLGFINPNFSYDFGIMILTIGGAILTIIAPLFGCFILNFRSLTILPIYIVLIIGVSIMFVIGFVEMRHGEMKQHQARLGLAIIAWSTIGVMVITVSYISL